VTLTKAVRRASRSVTALDASIELDLGIDAALSLATEDTFLTVVAAQGADDLPDVGDVVAAPSVRPRFTRGTAPTCSG
jgi:hypothetical protein